jgi:hypothetical protein
MMAEDLHNKSRLLTVQVFFIYIFYAITVTHSCLIRRVHIHILPAAKSKQCVHVHIHILPAAISGKHMQIRILI